jgi:branched-chain amino acid transport system permease protein
LYPGLDVNLLSYFYILGLFIVVVFVAYYLRRSKYGLALKSIGQNEEAAEHMGINTTLLKVLIFTLSSFFIGAAGAIIAFRSSYTDPGTAFAITYSFYPVLMAIFGGMGYLYGPIIGAIIFYYLNDRLSSYTTYYLLFFGLVMVLAVTFLPNGILGIIDKLIRRSKRGTVKADAPAGRN